MDNETKELAKSLEASIKKHQEQEIISTIKRISKTLDQKLKK